MLKRFPPNYRTERRCRTFSSKVCSGPSGTPSVTPRSTGSGWMRPECRPVRSGRSKTSGRFPSRRRKTYGTVIPSAPVGPDAGRRPDPLVLGDDGEAEDPLLHAERSRRLAGHVRPVLRDGGALPGGPGADLRRVRALDRGGRLPARRGEIRGDGHPVRARQSRTPVHVPARPPHDGPLLHRVDGAARGGGGSRARPAWTSRPQESDPRRRADQRRDDRDDQGPAGRGGGVRHPRPDGTVRSGHGTVLPPQRRGSITGRTTTSSRCSTRRRLRRSAPARSARWCTPRSARRRPRSSGTAPGT